LRDPDDVWQQVLDRLTGETVQAALQMLPVDQQEVVVKAYYQGIRPVDIARELGIAEGTVRSRLRLALVKLRESLASVREELTQ
jgi:RNA polymerase sigma-70 factor (ECF subfamily)